MYRALLSITVISLLLIASCKDKPTPPTPPVPVNLFTVKAVPVVYHDRYTGTTVALMQVNLLPQVQGYITGIFFKEGSHVKKGQKLYEIDQRIYQNNLQAAVANQQVAAGNLKQAQEDADRYTYLNKEKAVAKQLYDHAIVALENAKNSYKAAGESVRTAKTNLNYSVITAPFDGTIGISQVKVGDLMTVGQTVMNTISTDDPMAVDFLINEKQLPQFAGIQARGNRQPDSLFTMLLPDNSSYPYTGQLSVIDRAVNAQTGSIRVRLVFPNPKYFLRAGMSCIVKVRNQDTMPQMLIPNKAVIEQMGEFFVYVARDTTISKADSSSKEHKEETYQGMVAMQKKVKTGETIGPNVIVKEGIQEGDKIVVDGVQALHDGSHITLANKLPPGAQRGDKGGGKGGAQGGQ